jgi:hypothetical protein
MNAPSHGTAKDVNPMTSTITRTTPPQRLINVVNPVVRATLESPALHGALDRALIVLHVPGRKTGHVYDTPVGFVALDERLVVVTQHRWRSNLRGGGIIDVTRHGRREPMRVTLDEDPASVGRMLNDVLDRRGRKATERFTGLKLGADHAPSVADLANAARDFDLAIITLTPVGTR